MGAASAQTEPHSGEDRGGPAKARLAPLLSNRARRLQRALDLLDGIALDDVPDPHVVVVLERHAAFLPGLHLSDFVLEALERRQLALMNDHTVADEADVRAALHDAIGHAATRHQANLG